MARRAPDDPQWLIADNIRLCADALTRQADVMERDVEAEEVPKDVETAVQNTFYNITREYIDHISVTLAKQLDDLITRPYSSDMARAQAIRGFQKRLAGFEGLEIEL